MAINDSKEALQNLAKESIESRSFTAAKFLADFLYERDDDIISVKGLSVNEETYTNYLVSKNREVIYTNGKVSQPLYKEIAYYDENLNEILKLTNPNYDGEDVILEDFKSKVENLNEGEIWVSRLWGDVLTISEAYAGIEKPDGERYAGYYRWVTPVYENNNKVGYISLKLDARHVMELIDHISPTEERFVDMPNAPSGNYAYFVDDEGWIGSHPREYHIKGILNGQLATSLSANGECGELATDTKPLDFDCLAGFSKGLAEIHTIHAMNGESGSQTYLWAGLNKWIAYSTVHYNTGSNYNDEIGFGWLAVGAEINHFNEPMIVTETNINEKTELQEQEMTLILEDAQSQIEEATSLIATQNIFVTIATILISLVVIILFARTLTKPINELTTAANKMAEGNLDIELPKISTGDEIEELSNAMNMLTGALKFLKKESKKGKK